MERHYRGVPFPVADRNGRDYLLTPLYRAETASDDLPPRTFAEADLIGYRTADGRPAMRTGTGRFRLAAGAAGAGTELFAVDPVDGL